LPCVSKAHARRIAHRGAIFRLFSLLPLLLKPNERDTAGTQFAPPEPTPEPQRRHENRHYALAIVVLIPIAVLAVVILSRARQPAPPKTTGVDVAMFQEKVP
jgi:hypothetical protein